jgi:acyl-CoA dehydrogenase
VVFDRPIGKNQGVQFPIAEAYIEVEAANLMRFKACALFDAQRPCGAQANMAKYLAAKASWEAANVCLQTHGGFGFACEYDVERKLRGRTSARPATVFLKEPMDAAPGRHYRPCA